jgi:hypothetical protein
MTLKLSDLKRIAKKPWQRSKAATVTIDGRRSIKLSAKAFAKLTKVPRGT